MEIITLIYLVFGFVCGYIIGKNSQNIGVNITKEEMSSQEKQTLENMQKQLEGLISYSGGGC